MDKKPSYIVQFLSLILLFIPCLVSCPEPVPEEPHYTVKYDANGADGGEAPVDSNFYKMGDPVTIPNIDTLYKVGNSFSGWSPTQIVRGIIYAPNSIIPMSNYNLLLFAIWKPIAKYTLRYDSNGADSGTTPLSFYDYEGVQTNIASNSGNLSKDTFFFSGWNDKSDGSGTRYLPGEVFRLGNSDTTLYAQWIELKSIGSYTINTFVGTGQGNSGTQADDTAAANFLLPSPTGLAIDSKGHLYIASGSTHKIFVVKTDGTMKTIVGNGETTGAGFSGDAGSSVSAQVNQPDGLAISSSDDLYIADRGNQRIRRIFYSSTTGLADGVIETVAGNGTQAYAGDGSLPNSASLNNPSGISFDNKGWLYIADTGNNVIRVIPGSSIQNKIYTFAGTGVNNFSGDGGFATSAAFRMPLGIAFDKDSNLYVTDWGNSRIRKIFYNPANDFISFTNTIISVAGITTPGMSGDGGAASSASLNSPTGIAVKNDGAIIFSDTGNNRIRAISDKGSIETISGNDTAGFGGDGGSSLQGILNKPNFLLLASDGKIYISDQGNHRVRILTPSTALR